jgi:hypothetical protein
VRSDVIGPVLQPECRLVSVTLFLQIFKNGTHRFLVIVGLEEILKKVAGKCVKDEKGGEIAKDVFFRLEFEPQEYIFKQSK